MRFLKLLHLYHNINNTAITDGEGTSQNTIIFCRISFLNGNNSVFYEFNGANTIEHNGMICLGETVKEEDQSVFKDMYKVLHDGKQLLYINQPFTISFFKLVSKDPADGNTDVSVYNSSESHLIQPITIQEFRNGVGSSGQYISFTFEYQEDYSK
tara:strand:- start:1223 stop:1687 length:465 start_codon:yes stop_codon:yes gene_type:complete